MIGDIAIWYVLQYIDFWMVDFKYKKPIPKVAVNIEKIKNSS